MSIAPNRVRVTLIWIIILALGAIYKPISAQEGNQVRLAPISNQEFPKMSTYMEVRSAEGEFIHGLETQNVRIIEDGVKIPVEELQHLNTGVQFVLAVSPGQAFEIRDVQGVSRYEYLAQALKDWSQARQGSTVDDLSIIISEGPEISHLTDIERWSAVLDSFTPSGEEADPGFDVLTQALDIAADPTATPGMSRVVLFVTPLPEQDVSLGLQSLAARAAQQGVKVFIWLVTSSELFTSPQAEQMRQLAQDTGGELFAYSGQEVIPSPEEFLDKLRDTYFLSYHSRITTSGVHQTAAEINHQGEVFTSPSQEFEIEVLAPSIAFMSPPMEIDRKPTGEEEEVQNLEPNTQNLDLLLEFPDGFSRPIEETRFFVDGVLIAVNRQEPFDQFTWDISQLNANGEHILVAEVEDSLGLSGQSVETSVVINVSGTDTSLLGMISQNRMILVAVMMAILAALVLLIFVLGGRLQPGFLRDWRRKRKRNGRNTQPIYSQSDGISQSRPSWITTKPIAQFIPLTDSNMEKSQPPLAIISSQVFIGRDENQVDHVLSDASVEGIHANLERETEDLFRLSDKGSIAGTWVNYLPVPEGGQILKHGDLVHFGRMGFRFILRNPKHVRKPVVRFEVSQ